MLAGGRDFLIPFRSIPITARLLCALPAVLLTSLFFMDQNISVRVVNNPDNKLRKGEAYNLDMIALGIVTLGEFYIIHISLSFCSKSHSRPFKRGTTHWSCDTINTVFDCYTHIKRSITGWPPMDVWRNSAVHEPCSGNEPH
mmetsp:Transcript_41086/g.62200  ORF Transcript_41086/g.62200 Transcript_41086/m.62200 type:complete len:142 (+) Transcript_41086:1542-1967(+)